MGKATIISGGAGGEYAITLNLHRDRVTAELAALAGRIAALNDYIATLAEGPAREAAILSRVALEKRVQYLTDNVPADPVVAAWCVDLSEDLSGEVGTIEIPGERNGTPVLIRPGYGGGAVYSAARDGQLQPCLGGTAASTFYNLAMLPGWQKWRPTFRLGEITAKAGLTCSVAIDPASSSAQSLNVNQDTADGLVTLTDVPFDYMTCHGVAFSVGDRVVVMFTDQDWSQPKVIGFEDNPRHCEIGVLVVKITGYYYESVFPTAANPQPAMTDIYLVWDSGLDAPLQLPKTGGGFWTYPLAEVDYLGLFQTDLAAYFGGTVNAANLADEIFVTEITSAMDISAAYTGVPYSFEGVGLISWQQDHNDPLLETSLCIRELEGETDSCMASLAAGSSQDLANTITGETVANEAGGVDTWSDDVATHYGSGRSYAIDVSFVDGMWVGMFLAPGSFTDARSGSRATSFSAPVGGVPSTDFYLGYMATTGTLVPPPALSLSLKLTNAFGAVVLGPAITYSGSHTFADSYELEYQADWSNATICRFSNIQSGAGTMTFLDGTEKTISASFSESGTVVNTDGGTFIWPTYAPVKTVDFAASEIHIADGRDEADDFKAVIVLETQESAHIEATMVAPSPPHSGYVAPTDGAPVVTGREVNYYLAYVKCQVGGGSYASDPWTFAENEALKTGIYSAITAFRAANPLADPADRWVIRPEIQILKW